MKTNQIEQTSPLPSDHVASRGNIRRRWLGVALLLGVLAVLAIVWWSGVFDNSIDEFLSEEEKPLPKDGRPAFVVTRDPSLKPSPTANATLLRRVEFLAHRLRHHRTKNPAAAVFSGPFPSHYRVKDMLTESTIVTGTRYLIAREAVDRTVPFGLTNAVNGLQWQAAVEQGLRKESLLLIRERPGEVKVIPTEDLDRYQKAGLVKKQN